MSVAFPLRSFTKCVWTLLSQPCTRCSLGIWWRKKKYSPCPPGAPLPTPGYPQLWVMTNCRRSQATLPMIRDKSVVVQSHLWISSRWTSLCCRVERSQQRSRDAARSHVCPPRELITPVLMYKVVKMNSGKWLLSSSFDPTISLTKSLTWGKWAVDKTKGEDSEGKVMAKFLRSSHSNYPGSRIHPQNTRRGPISTLVSIKHLRRNNTKMPRKMIRIRQASQGENSACNS